MYACANLSYLFQDVGNLLARYKAAAEAGFKFVECDFPKEVTPDELSAVVKDTGLQQLLINCYYGNDGELGFAAMPGSQKDFQDSLKATIGYANASCCKKIHILSGMSLGCEHRAEQMRTLEENLNWASNTLEEEKIVGLIEPINPYSKPNYFLNCFDTVIERIGSPYIRLQLDLFHLQMISGNITNNIKKLLPYTGHVQIAQSPHRHEPSLPGELNMQFVLSELSKAGYSGPLGCEYIPSGSTIDSLKWIKDYGVSF